MARAHARLAFAVVAQAGGFEHAGQQVFSSGSQISLCFDHGVGRRGHAALRGALGEAGFFTDAVLRDGNGVRRRGDGAQAGQFAQGGGRHVFKFGGDGVGQARHFAQGLSVFVSSLDEVVAGAPGGAGGVRVEHHGFKAKRLRGAHEHAAQLAAAEHAERGGAAFNDLAGQKGQEGSRGHLGYFSDWTWVMGHGSWGGRLRACTKSAGRAGAAR